MLDAPGNRFADSTINGLAEAGEISDATTPVDRNGFMALRHFAEVRCEVPGLPQDAAKRLLGHLKRVESAPLPRDKDGYLAQVGLEGQPEQAHAVIENFLKARFDFLQQQPVSQPASRLEGGLAAES